MKHLSVALRAFFPSPFDEAAILTLASALPMGLLLGLAPAVGSTRRDPLSVLVS